LAQWFGERVAAGGSVTGYELRSAYPASPSLCLTAVTDSPAAGQDGGGVEASPCTRSAPSQIWIPVQYEARGASYTWLANDKYQSKWLFLGAGNYSLDADDKSLQGGLPVAPVSIINHYTVSWEYWY